MVAAVPSGATSGPVVVTVAGTPSNNLNFTVTGAVINSLNPSAGGVGTSVTISGSGFGSSQGNSAVNFGSIVATATSWADQIVIVPVPAGAASAPVYLTINSQPTNGLTFTIGPNIVSAVPTSGAPGTTVTISGSGFGATQGSSSVTFNGVPASPTSWSDTNISVPVPNSATSGSLVVIVGGYTSNGIAFAVAPSINGLLPSGGPVGTPITISGLNFELSQGSGTVTFNGAAGTPTSWGPASITVPVPSGASTGPVVVTTGGQSSNGVTFTVGTGTLAGTVSRTSDHQPVSGASVQALQSNNVIASASSASDGTYTIGNLIPGTYDVRVTASGYGTALSTGNLVAANQTTQVNVSLSSPGTISGQITQQNGQTAISGASITVFEGTDTVGQTSSDGNGMYSVSSLTAGSYSVQASAAGYNTQSQTNIQVTVGNSTPANFSLTGQTNITYEYDDAGRLIGVVDSANGAAKYTYDAVGNILSISRTAAGQVAIIGFSPSSGPVGSTVTINGTGFSSNPSQDTVTFNGVSASIVSATTTQIVATVPTGATTGPISVTAPGGSDTTSNQFTVTSGSGGPSITGFSPQIGSPGTPVAITGTGFDPTAGNNRIKFGNAFAVVTSASNNSLSTSVPAQAVSALLSVTTTGGSASSNSIFYVVPDGMTCTSFDFTTTVALNGQFGGTIGANNCALVMFSANAGQKIDLSTNSSLAGSVVYLQGPDGSQVDYQYYGMGQNDLADVLPLTGNYVVLIINLNGVPLTLNGYVYDNSDEVYAATIGQPVTISTHYNQVARVTFAGGSGQHLLLSATNITYPAIEFTNVFPINFFTSTGKPIQAINFVGQGGQSEEEADLLLFQSDNDTMTVGPTLTAGGVTFIFSIVADRDCGSLNDGFLVVTGPYQFCRMSFTYNGPIGQLLDVYAQPLPNPPPAYYTLCDAALYDQNGAMVAVNLDDCGNPGSNIVLEGALPGVGTYTFVMGDAPSARFGGAAQVSETVGQMSQQKKPKRK